jgi:hypothetical protein
MTEYRPPPPQLDMTPDGRFRSPQRPPGMPLAARIGAWALLVAVGAGAIGVAALALWFALALIPVAVGAALVAWVAFRIQLWRVRRSHGFRRAVYRG